MTLTRVPILGAVRTELGASWRRKASTLNSSDHFDGTSFHNLLASEVLSPSSMPSIAKAMLTRGDIGKPQTPVPLAVPSFAGPVADLAVTWMGHASALIEVDGIRVLADPVWSDRVSPSQLVGPKRMHPVPVHFDELPPIDAVIISHDHYDHLDLRTIQWLRDRHQAPFLVPLGVDEHLTAWGVPPERIIALHRGQAFLRSRPDPQRHVVVVLGAGRFRPSGFLRRRHRLHAGIRRRRSPVRPVRPDAHSDRCVQRALGGHPSEPRAGCPDALGLLAAAKEHDINVLIPQPGQRVDDLTAAENDGWWDRV